MIMVAIVVTRHGKPAAAAVATREGLIDTSALVSELLKCDSISSQLLQVVRDGSLDLVTSVPRASGMRATWSANWQPLQSGRDTES